MSKIVLVFMAYISLLLLGLMDNIRGPFYPDILNDLSLNSTMGSLFFATASFSALGGNFLGSFLLTKLSAHGLMNYSIAGLGFGFFLMGMSSDFPILISACVVFGIHFGLLNVSQNVVVQKNASPFYRRRIFNGLHAMYGLSALVAPLLATLLIAVGFDWKKSFLYVGLFSMLVGIGFLIKGWSFKEPALIEVTSESQKSFNVFSALLLALSLALYMVCELSLSTRFPLWARETFSMSARDANNYMAIFCGGLFVGRISLTFVSLNHISNVFILYVSGVSAILLYVLGLLYHPMFAALSGLAMGPFFPVVLDEMSWRFEFHGARVISWAITLGSVCIVIMHFTLGVLTDQFGIDKALWFGPVALSLSLVSLALSSRRLGKK